MREQSAGRLNEELHQESSEKGQSPRKKGRAALKKTSRLWKGSKVRRRSRAKEKREERGPKSGGRCGFGGKCQSKQQKTRG